jgi:23S rRNA pseudouridine2605 synthase
MITEGKISVNGRIVSKLGATVTEADVVTVGGKLVKPASNLVYIAFNKPAGIITTSADEQKRKTVLDFMPREPRVVVCGRLDAASRGLVLLTNDGDLCYQLTHPKHEHEKEYRVVTTINHGPAIEERINRLEKGVKLEDGTTSPAKVTNVERRQMQLHFSITIHEGKNRQVRRMCSAVGLDVVDLERVRIGKFTMSKLAEGRWRLIKKEEIL